MLTLVDSLRVGSVTAYRDVVRVDGERRYTHVFYVVPASPRICVDEAGDDAVHMLWYRGALDGDGPARGGALLSLAVDLTLSTEERASAVEALSKLLPASSPEVELRPLPVVSGTVALSLGGESEDGVLVERVLGGGAARLSGWERATFFVQLTAEGAALVDQALRGGHAVLHARYELTFEHRLDQARLRVWADGRKVWRDAAAALDAGSLEVPRLREGLVAKRLAGYEVIPEGPLPDALRERLERLGAQLLDAALKSALFTADATEGDGTEAPRLKPFEPAVDASLNVTYSESYVATQTESVEGNLSPVLSPEQIARHVRRVDLEGGFFRVLEVKVYCTADFGRGLVSAVKVRLDYDAVGAAGRVQRSEAFVFQDSATTGTFRTELADPSALAYRYEAEVFYEGISTPTRLTYPPTERTALVLDLDGLGVLDVSACLVGVPFERVRAVTVELEYPSRSLSERLFLDADTPAASWRVVVRDHPLLPYRYRAIWILTDDRRVEGEWTESRSPKVFIGAPPDVDEAGRVLLVASGDFSALAQLSATVAVEREQQTFTFRNAGESYEWRPSGEKQGALRYRVRYAMVYRDGIARETDWFEEERPVLVVRDALRFEVRVVARRLDLGGALRMAILTLDASDPENGIRETRVFTLVDRLAATTWSFRIAAPERHRYRYQLTLVPAAGPRQTTAWADADAELLVLQPSP